jgi:glycosyltransferase involved in cell wall biosynthesis
MNDGHMASLVTVCIPAYNGAMHLAECLDSVCQQTYDNIDILVVDDSSSDHTPDIVVDYEKRDSRVRFVRNQSNLGLVGNWHRCIELARGEYIKFAFQDDVLYPACVESLMRATQRGPRFAFCAREFIAEEGTSKELIESLERGRRRINGLFAARGLISPELFCESILGAMPTNIVGEPSVTLMHRDIPGLYGRFNSDFLQIVDLEYWCRIGANENISYVPTVLAKFRLHSGSATSRNLAQRLYQAEELDNLLLLHEFAFSPIFRLLREIARKRSPTRDIIDLFYQQAYWLAANAREHLDVPGASGGTELNALEAFAQRYPAMLSPVPFKYTLARKWRALKKRLGLIGPSHTSRG